MDLMLIIFCVSLLIVVLGAVVRPIQNIFLTEPMVSMILGVAMGSELLNVIQDIPNKFTVLELAAEFTIAMALMATALRIPHHFYRNNYITQTNIVLGGMGMMWLASGCVVHLLMGSLTFAESLLIGAVITPTDPVIASTIVTGEKAQKYLPGPIRNTLSFESGMNDGLAYPIVLLSVFLVDTADFSTINWLIQNVLYETVACGILAYFIGSLAGVAMDKAHRTGTINTKSLFSFSLGLAFLLLAGLDILQMNGIIGVFIGGIAYSKHISNNDEIQEERVQETMERIFTIPVFFIFGLMLPWNAWVSLGWTAIGIVLLVLIFRRLPALLILRPLLNQFNNRFYDVLVIGWFGPIGVAALYYAIHAQEKTALDEIWVITSLVVFASTIVHGITSLPVEKWYYKKVT